MLLAAVAAALPVSGALLSLLLLLAPAAAATTTKTTAKTTPKTTAATTTTTTYADGVLTLNATLQLIEELSIKLSTVSTVPEFYNLMAQYNTDYCSRDVLDGLKKYSHSRPAKMALQNMQKYCRTINKKELSRRQVRKAKKRIQKEIENEAAELAQVLSKSSRAKTGCKPRRTIVPLPTSPGALLLPRCAAVKRCSGCCQKALQSCAPAPGRVKRVKRKVVEIQVDTSPSESTLRRKVKEVELEQHDACECTCQGNATMCSPKEVFDEHNCSCVCRNDAERKLCEEPRFWNTAACECECRNWTACSSGYYPDPITCKCKRSSSINNLTAKLRKNARGNKRS